MFYKISFDNLKLFIIMSFEERHNWLDSSNISSLWWQLSTEFDILFPKNLNRNDEENSIYFEMLSVAWQNFFDISYSWVVITGYYAFHIFLSCHQQTHFTELHCGDDVSIIDVKTFPQDSTCDKTLKPVNSHFHLDHEVPASLKQFLYILLTLPVLFYFYFLFFLTL